MKTLFAFALLAALALNASAQKTIGSETGDNLSFMLPNRDGSKLVLYYSSFGFDSSSVAIAHVNANLDPIATRSYTMFNRGVQYWTAATPWPGGGWLAAGKYIYTSGFGPLVHLMYLFRLKPNGDTVRIMRLDRDTNDDRILAMEVDTLTKDISLFVHQGAGAGQVSYVKTDSMGRIKKQYRVTHGGQDMFLNGAVPNRNNRRVLFGDKYVMPGPRQIPYMVFMRDTVAREFLAFDPDPHQAYSTQVIPMPDKGLLLGAIAYSSAQAYGLLFVRLDSNRTVRWKKAFELTGFASPALISSMIPLANGDVLITGTFSFVNAFSGRVTTQGDLVDTKYHNYPGVFPFSYMQLIPEFGGSFLAGAQAQGDIALFRTNAQIAGVCETTPLPFTPLNWTIAEIRDTVQRSAVRFTTHFWTVRRAPRTHSTGMLPCPMAVAPYRDPAPLAVYPNPARSLFYIEGIGATQPYELEMIDTQGKPALRKLHRSGEAVSIEGVPKGVYRIQVRMGDKIRTGVVVVE